MENKKKKSLNKGLEEIFGSNVDKIISDIQNNNTFGSPTTIELEKLIVNPFQPRKNFKSKEIEELSKSIKENGVFTPILIKENKAGKFYIIAGERRVRASKLAGLKMIPAIIAKISNDGLQRIALIENIQREDLNPIEIAISISAMIKNQKLTQEDAAKIIGKSRSYIANLLGLLKLDKKILNAILDGTISYSHAKPLITLSPDQSLIIYRKIKENNLSVREVEAYAKIFKLKNTPKNKKTIIADKKAQEIIYAEELIRNKLETKVKISKNEICIKYKGKDQLSKIIKKMDILKK